MISSNLKRSFLSLRARLLFIVALASVLYVAIFALSAAFIEVLWLACTLGLLVSVITSATLILLLSKQLRLGLEAVNCGLLNFLDNDFSVTLARNNIAELDQIALIYNKLAESLRRERQSIFQRELLLDTVIENSSMCVVISDNSNRIIYSNRIAEGLLNGGKSIKGSNLDEVLQAGSEVLRKIIEQAKNGIFRIGSAGAGKLYYVSCGKFVLNSQRNNLILIKEMTREVGRQEAEIWKKAIRVISHELNNSLAPISSMAHSGKMLLEQASYDSLHDIFSVLAERADHLKTFAGSYAQIAKLPLPVMQSVSWEEFIRNLAISYRFTLSGELPEENGCFDPGQMQQVLVNLLKNAAESGSDCADITVEVTQSPSSSVIEIADRGTGMSQQVMENALIPFYTTKTTGSGVGLPLCREVVEAHDGAISLANRSQGGLKVRIVLPLSDESRG